ncbi:hypothetical protein J2W32_006460 [Variovorax boronicumulans]|uniref:Uncharacterized protein n=1 Tax=Variovorax boronicumulans TaxID=436515 RepID=A0AAW8D9Q8_9BURK|nr:hypothetical protein [Variovorax boronicumulans]MDP9897383.1 hypothetical protein [Variovorax boronicumulans]MDQ0057383.1 hypothetical protein [Variovorax boronicumulans]
MNATQEIDPGFAWIAHHGGPAVDWADSINGHRHHVLGEGLAAWFASNSGEQGKPLGLSKHVDDANGTRMLELRAYNLTPPGAEPVHWGSTLRVGEGRYVRASGSAADFPTALAEVEAHRHESRQLAGLTWWCEAQYQWITWLGALSLRATQIASSTKDPYWHFEVRGEAPTLEEAALLAVLGRLNINGAGGAQGA